MNKSEYKRKHRNIQASVFETYEFDAGELLYESSSDEQVTTNVNCLMHDAGSEYQSEDSTVPEDDRIVGTRTDSSDSEDVATGREPFLTAFSEWAVETHQTRDACS